MSFNRNPQLEGLAALTYTPLLPYHNFEHAQSTIKSAEKILTHCLEEGVRADGEIIYRALLFHDAGYHQDNINLGFPTKEELSANIAGRIMFLLNLDARIILATQRAIISTHKDAPFITNEEKIVRAADLAGMVGDYQTFLKNTLLLKKEAELFEQRKIPIRKWKEKTRAIIEFYLSQDIRLTSHYSDNEGNSVFHTRARANLERFLKE